MQKQSSVTHSMDREHKVNQKYNKILKHDWFSFPLSVQVKQCVLLLFVLSNCTVKCSIRVMGQERSFAERKSQMLYFFSFLALLADC